MKWVMFLGFDFIGFTLIGRICEGTFFNTSDIAIMNSLTVFKDVSVFNLFSLPALNLDFFFVGIPKLIQWDYGFFGGSYELTRYFLYVLSMGVIFLIFSLVLYALGGLFKR